MSQVRTLVLLFLLMGSSLGALAQPAAAQASPTIMCFDRDPRFAGTCVQERPPDYEQGATISVSMEGFLAGPSSAFMSARCVKGCPTGDPSSSKTYWAQYAGGGAQFPQDFIDSGPNGDGGNAVLDKAPRYNSTWEFEYHITTPVKRQASVWLYDAWEDDSGNHTVRPGATHQIRAAGFDPNGEVVYRWERREPNGRFAPILSSTTRASASGVFTADFQLPKAEAQRISACGGNLFECYRIVISGAGKLAETVYVQVALGDIVRSLDTTPRQNPADDVDLKRTMNATAYIDLYYPSGRLRTGPKFSPDDAPFSLRHGGRALRVVVEKFYNVNQSAYLLDEVPLRYDPQRLVWTTQWTVPKDVAIENGARYRLRLIEQHDAYTNVVRGDTLVNFTIEPAEMLPKLIDPLSELRRTEEGTMRVAVLYHNGTPFTPDDAPVGQTNPIRGCFVRVPAPAPSPAPSTEVPSCSSQATSVQILNGQYYDGAWNFTVKYGRTYEHLDRHRFITLNGTTDRWGNDIWSIASDPFVVKPAQPVIEFSTVMRSAETEVLERGNRVYVSAAITYHDGTPYNHHVRVDPNTSAASVLSGTLIRRGPAVGGATVGPIASEETFNLSETEPSAGRWGAYLQLTDDDTFTPVGVWTWKFDIVDNVTGSAPNRNLSVNDREVVSSVIRLCPTTQPAGSVPTGTVLRFRFRLYYSECDTGREVAAGAVESQLSGRVFRYNQQTQAPFGAPVSNSIIPAYSRDGSHDWGIEYQVPNDLFAGTYVFALTGADTFGNKLMANARSRPFSTFTDVLTRSVITQPPDEVARGDSATIVFDAREGDTGVDPNRPVPRIQLERFDTSSTDCPRGATEGGCWAREVADVRLFDQTLADHVGVFPVGVDTPVGLYRFSLQGRDREFHIITGVSENFTVRATQVERALLVTPPERVVKGEPFSFYVETQPGDQIRERVTFLNGRPIFMPQPLVTPDRGRLNVTWSIPFEAPTGNYTLRLTGRDVNGNIINIISPPIDALPASLEGRIVGQPPKTLERGEMASLHFGVGYPDGSFYAAADEPRVSVVSAAGVTYTATVRREGLSFAAVWSPHVESPLGEYYFEVSPQAANGGTGNLFPPLRSNAFRIVPGVVTRGPVDDLGAEVERFVQAAYSVPFAADDKYVGFELVYYGPSLSTAIDTTTQLLEVTRTPLPHTLDAGAGKYVARLATDHQSQTGTFKIEMIGEDGHGNTIRSVSRPFVIRPTTIGVVPDTPPSADKFGEGKTITLSFTARYRAGVIMDEMYGRPSATVLWNGNPVTQRPDIYFRDGRWYMTWTAPAILPPGEYQFLIGGSDLMGNPIATARSTPYYVAEPTLPESFAKTVPGPSPLLLLVGLAALALVLARKRSG